MSRKKPGWTEPGTVIDRAAQQAADARKGTAAEHPVLSLAPNQQPPARRPSASTGADAGHEPTPGASPAEIEAEIERTRDRLAGTLDELTERLSPRAVLRRANGAVRGVFVAADGSVRRDRAALAAGALVSAVGGAVALRSRRR
jgi:hypothetical protein